MVKGKPHSSEFKTKIVLETLREDQTINQIAAKYGIHPNNISTWRSTFLKSCSSVFSNHPAEVRLKELENAFKEKEENLIKQIGELSVKLNWSEKKIKELEHGN